MESKKNLFIFKKHGKSNPRNEKYQVWIQDNHPQELDTNFLMEQKLEYLHMNPVKAGLVQNPENYKYSSASNYYGSGGTLDVTILE